MELTEVKFWEEYWGGCKIPKRIDERNSFDRCLASALRDALVGSRGEIFEIGCAPGKWLAFFAEELGLRPSGVEYTTSGMAATARNLEMLGIGYGKIWDGDFFELEPVERFDVVASFGFIEHFSDPGPVIERHLEWLKPGGRLVIGVPNFRGVYGPLQSLIDGSILDKHNTEVMDLEFFRGIAAGRGLDVLRLGYIGSFEPALPIFRPGEKRPLVLSLRALLRLIRRVRRLRFLDAFNSSLFSSYILAVYRKRGES